LTIFSVCVILIAINFLRRCIVMQERAFLEERLSGLKHRDPVLDRLGHVLWEFIQMQYHPTPYGLRQIAEVLIEVRRILLADDLAGTLTQEAIQQIEWWIENTKRGNSYELAPVLRDISRQEV
jgi:hypothetical protein